MFTLIYYKIHLIIYNKKRKVDQHIHIYENDRVINYLYTFESIKIKLYTLLCRIKYQSIFVGSLDSGLVSVSFFLSFRFFYDPFT